MWIFAHDLSVLARACAEIEVHDRSVLKEKSGVGAHRNLEHHAGVAKEIVMDKTKSQQQHKKQCTRLRLIGIDDQERRTAIGLLGHEGPLQAGGKTSSTTATKSGSLQLVHNPIRAWAEQENSKYKPKKTDFLIILMIYLGS